MLFIHMICRIKAHPINQLRNLLRWQLDIHNINPSCLLYTQAFIRNSRQQSIPLVFSGRLQRKSIRRICPRRLRHRPKGLRAVGQQLQLHVALNQALLLQLRKQRLHLFPHAHDIATDIIRHVKRQILFIRVAIKNIYFQPSASNRHPCIKLCTLQRLLQAERITKRNKAIGQRFFSIHIILL